MKLPGSSRQYYLQMTNRLGIKSSREVWTQLKHHPLCPCRQFSVSSQLIASAATNSAHPLWSRRKSPLSLISFTASIQPPSSLLSFPWPRASGTIFCVCFVKNKTYTVHKVHEAPSPQLYKEVLTIALIQSSPHKKNPNTPIRQEELPLLVHLNFRVECTHTDYLSVLRNMLELCLDLQTLLTGLKWTGRSNTWLLQVLAWS